MKSTLVLLVLIPAILFAADPPCGTCTCGAKQKLQVKSKAQVQTESHCHWLEVTGLEPGSPARAAGIKPGDVIKSYDGNTIGCLKDLQFRRDAATAETVRVVVERAGADLEIHLPKGKLGVFLKEWQQDLTPDPDAVLVKDVPQLDWQTGSNTFMGALEALLRSRGSDDDYVFLCGVSGSAFRTHFFDTWCPSSPDPSVGYDATRPALTACGYKPTQYSLASDGKNEPELLKAICSSVDAGVPVLAIDLIETPEWGIITGYQKAGEELLCRTYFDKRKNYDLAQKFPFTFIVLTPSAGRPDALASYRNSFPIVVQNLTTRKYGEYYSGLAAFDKWVERIRTDDFAGRDSAGFSEVLQANYWTFSRLIDDRTTGIEYLARLAGVFPELKPKFDDLVALYQQEVDLLGPVLAELPCPGTCLKPTDWAAEKKELEAQALFKARGLEEQALAIWQELAAK